jgi:hypothetical protein
MNALECLLTIHRYWWAIGLFLLVQVVMGGGDGK